MVSGWLWIGIISIVIFIAWVLLKKKKKGYEIVRHSEPKSLWEKVKDACCRYKEQNV